MRPQRKNTNCVAIAVCVVFLWIAQGSCLVHPVSITDRTRLIPGASYFYESRYAKLCALYF